MENSMSNRTELKQMFDYPYSILLQRFFLNFLSPITFRRGLLHWSNQNCKIAIYILFTISYSSYKCTEVIKLDLLFYFCDFWEYETRHFIGSNCRMKNEKISDFFYPMLLNAVVHSRYFSALEFVLIMSFLVVFTGCVVYLV